MGNFNREGDKNGGGGFRSGGRNGQRDGGRQGGFLKKEWGGRDSGNKEQMMHQATCSECGKRCEVPFRPVSGKPVFCTECFSAKRGGSTSGDRVPAKMHYEKRENRGGEGGDGLRRQISEMNTKLDRLVKAVETLTGTGPKTVVIEASKKEEKKSVDVAGLKKVLDTAIAEPGKAKAPKETKKETKADSKKTVKKAASAKKK